MQSEQDREELGRSSKGRQAVARRATVAATLLCGSWLALGLSPLALGPSPIALADTAAEDLGQQTRVPGVTQARPSSDYSVLFEFTQSERELGGSTADQITVIFSNRSIEGPRAPVPLFGEDILQEFSFSGRNFVNNQLRFTRRVRDMSFLGARYIRVVNHGGDGWAGDTISLTVDGKSILRNERMWPRRGASKSGMGGIEKFNASDWNARSYWEYDQQGSRGASAR